MKNLCKILFVCIILLVPSTCFSQGQKVPEFTAYSYSDAQRIIVENVEAFNPRFNILYKGGSANILQKGPQVIRDALGEREDLFARVAETSYIIKGNALRCIIEIKLGYHTTKQMEKETDKMVDELAKKLNRPFMSDIAKVKKVNDYICKNATYSLNTKTSPNSAYTILKEGKGVCQAYALLAYKLLNKMGVHCEYVDGYAVMNGKKIGHAWNMVNIDGKWYNLDVTWNDTNDDKKFRHKFFLLADNEFSKTHERIHISPRYKDAVATTSISLKKETTKRCLAIGFFAVCIGAFIALIVIIVRKIFYRY